MSDAFMRQPIIPTPNSAMTGVTTIKSQAFYMGKFSGCSFQPVWTGTPTGTFTVMISNDYNPAANGSQVTPQNAGTWSNLGASIPQNPAGAPGNTFVPIYASCGYWIQLWYTNTSGVGVLSGTFAGKYNG